MKFPPRVIVLSALLSASLSLNSSANTVSATPQTNAHTTSRALPLAALPPEHLVRQTLENLPLLRASTLNIDLAREGKSKLESGSYEWSLKVAGNRRTDQIGDRFNEQELALERPVRWFGKQQKDVAIGEKGLLIAETSRADNWHEAGRTLMKDWFDSLREILTVRRLQEQLAIADELRQIADKRVRAGDAAKLEAVMADTEYQRVNAMLQQARLREQQMLQLLKTSYPALPEPDPVAIAVPQFSADSADIWLDRILQDNHELELAQAQADLLSLQASRAASDKMPDPTIGFRAGRERDGQERIFGISISIPIPGSYRRSESDSAFLRAKIAQENLAQTRLKVRTVAQRVITQSQRSYLIWQSMLQVQQQSQNQANTIMTAYQLGEAALTDTLNARRQALDATLSAETAQIDALEAQARLQLDTHAIWSID